MSPIYEADCPEHGVFEEIKSFSESDDPLECPDCAASCERIISLPAVAQGDFGTAGRRSVTGQGKAAYRMEKYVGERLSGKNKGGDLQRAIRETGHKPATDDPGACGLEDVKR